MSHASRAPDRRRAREDEGQSPGAVSSQLPVQLRFSDTDKQGHVNNAVYATYAELGRLGFLAELGLSAASLILARLTIDFRRQVRLGDSCTIQTRVASLGRTSFTLEQTLEANGEVAAEFVAVMVWFDYQQQVPVPLPQSVRDALAGPADGGG